MVMHTKFMLFMMVLGVVSNEGHVMPPHFLSGFRVNDTFNIEVLDMVIKHFLVHVAYMLQQGFALTAGFEISSL